MSDINETITDTLEQIKKASLGLAVKVREESSKQYNELVALGAKEESAEENLVQQFRTFMEESFKDIKGTGNQVKLAGLGFAARVRDDSQSVFNELVELGTKEEKKPAKQAEAAAS